MSLLESMNLRQSAAHSLSTGKALEMREKDRVCGDPTCSTRLSRYNPAPCCGLHAGWSDPPRPRRGGVMGSGAQP